MRPQESSGGNEAAAGVDRVNHLYAVLSNVNEAIVRVHDPKALHEAACRIAVEDGHFILAWIGLVEAETQFIRCVAKYGRDDGYLDTISISLNEDVPEGRGPTGVALREGRPFINNDTENNPVMAPWREEQLVRGYRSSASFPLKAEGQTIGAITLYAGTADYFDAEEVHLLQCLADDFSFALESAEIARERSNVLEELRRARDELEARVSERTAVLQGLFEERTSQAHYAEALNRINRSLHSSLDFDEIMNRVVIEITEALDVDATVVQVRSDRHWEFAYEHGLPAELRHVRLSDAEVPISMSVLETRRPAVVNDVAFERRANTALMNEFGITSLMAVPLIMKGSVFGVLVADRFGEAAPFTEQQVDFLQKAAATLGLALENARLYESERYIADRLQEALLTMPEHVHGVTYANAYHSASEASRVGGDFYDLFELDQDHVGVVIGDVAGKGIDAAVLTSLVKNTIRAHASEKGKAPDKVMTLANEVIYRSTSAEGFVTALFGVLDCRDGRFVYSNSGHTTAAKLLPDGTVSELLPTGPVLGAFSDMQFDQSEIYMGADDTLFLYTDGLTEARGEDGEYGETRLFERLASMTALSTEDLVREVLVDAVAFSSGQLRDDLAILAIRRVGV